jgi:hypothetical protein
MDKAVLLVAAARLFAIEHGDDSLVGMLEKIKYYALKDDELSYSLATAKDPRTFKQLREAVDVMEDVLCVPVKADVLMVAASKLVLDEDGYEDWERQQGMISECIEDVENLALAIQSDENASQHLKNALNKLRFFL